MKNIRKLLVIMLASLLLFSGCGTADQEDSQESETEMGGQIETVTTDTFSMEYYKFGHGEEALVILPGLSVQSVMGFASAVEEAYQLLADEYTVYLVDLAVPYHISDGGGHGHYLKCRDNTADYGGKKLLGDHSVEYAGQLHGYLPLLVCGEYIDDTVDRVSSSHSMQCREYQVTCLSCSYRR